MMYNDDEYETSVEKAIEEDSSYNQYVGRVNSGDDDDDNNKVQPQADVEKAWYVINTFGSQERRVKEDLEKRKVSFHMEDKIFRVIVAEQEEPVLDENGKQKMVKDKVTGQKVPKFKTKNIYPGYIFVEMIMTDETWFVVRNTPGVSGITGSSGKGAKPFPIAREEIEPVFKRIGIDDPDMYSAYKVGDEVKIVSGMFMDSEGTIVSINSETSTVEVEITLFGRTQDIPAKFSEIEKVQEE